MPSRCSSGTATTDLLQIRWDGNWLLTELRLLAPCGTGEDLIDRLKGRALTDQGIVQFRKDWEKARAEAAARA